MTKKEIMLITGSSGRVGSDCVRRFADKFQVIGFDRHAKDHGDKAVHIGMDVSSDESVASGLEQVKRQYGSNIAAVIHLAAYYSFGNEHPELYDTITVQGTRRLLQGLQQFDDVGQFIFSSTLLVHKPCLVGEKINEEWPLEPKWDYPRSKVKTEEVIHRERKKIPAVIMRIAGCYDDDCHSIPIAHNIQRIYQHELESYLYPGDPAHGNPFLHLDDLTDAIESAVNKRESLPDDLTLLIGEDRTVGYGALQDLISEVLNHHDFTLYRIPKWMAKEGARVGDVLPFVSDKFVQPWMVDLANDHYALDITLAKKQLDWTPKHFIRDSLPVMMQGLKSDPVAWYKTNGLTVPAHIEDYVKAHAK